MTIYRTTPSSAQPRLSLPSQQQQQQQHPPTRPRNYVNPGENDIVRGRGGKTNNRQTHQWLLSIVRHHEQEYQTLKRGEKTGKYALGLHVVHLVRARGGRFLDKEYDDNGNIVYFEMDERSSVKLVQQKFRDVPDNQVSNSQGPIEIAQRVPQDTSGSTVISMDEDDDTSLNMVTAPIPMAEHSLSDVALPSHPHSNNLIQVSSSADTPSWNRAVVDQASVTVPPHYQHITPTTRSSEDLEPEPSEVPRLPDSSFVRSHRPGNDLSTIELSPSERDDLERYTLASLYENDNGWWMYPAGSTEPAPQAHPDAVLPQHLDETSPAGTRTDDLSRRFPTRH